MSKEEIIELKKITERGINSFEKIIEYLDVFNSNNDILKENLKEVDNNEDYR